MGSALERRAAPHELQAAREVAHELAREGRAQGLAAASVSANTRRAYEGALRRLRDWLAGRPLNDDTLAGYLAARFEAGRSPAVVAASGGGSVRGLRDAALLAVMSDGLLLRVSEAAEIEVADLEAEGANTLTIRRSKTDQEGEGAVQYIGGPTVDRVRAWLAAAAIADGAMFQRLDRAGRPRGRLSTVSVRAIVQRRAAEAGIEGRVSGHSLRVGGGAVPGRRRGLDRRDADRRPMAVPLPCPAATPEASSPPAARLPSSATGGRGPVAPGGGPEWSCTGVPAAPLAKTR